MAQPTVIMTRFGLMRISGEEMEWIGEERLSKLIGLIENPRNPKTWPRMPVFINDNLKLISERWAEMYPSEANGMLAEYKRLEMNTENGMSSERLMQRLLAIPEMIYWAMVRIDEHYWEKGNAKQYLRDFSSLMPKLCTKAQASGINYKAPIISKEKVNDKNRQAEVQSITVNDCEGRNGDLGNFLKKRGAARRRNSGKLERFKPRN